MTYPEEIEQMLKEDSRKLKEQYKELNPVTVSPHKCQDIKNVQVILPKPTITVRRDSLPPLKKGDIRKMTMENGEEKWCEVTNETENFLELTFYRLITTAEVKQKE